MHTHFLYHWRRPLAALLICAFCLVTLCPWPVSAQDAQPGQDIQPAQAAANIPCNDTPFGRMLELGRETEVMTSFVDPSGVSPAQLNWSISDRNANTGNLNALAFADLGVSPAPISALGATAADLDGNGKAEFVQSFTAANGSQQIVVEENGATERTYPGNRANQTLRALAAGNILGQPSDAQQVVVASLGADGVVGVDVFSRTLTGAPATPVLTSVANWRRAAQISTQSEQTLHVAVGNLDDDAFTDIVVSYVLADRKTVQLIYLEYKAGAQSGSGNTGALNLVERATTTLAMGQIPQRVHMVMADLAGSGQKSIAVTWDQSGQLGGLSPLLHMRILNVKDVNQTTQFVPGNALDVSTNSQNFALAAGDVDADGREEIVLGYDTEGNSTFGNLNIVALRLENQDTPNPVLRELTHWQDANDGRNSTNFLALGVGDFNRDRRAEVVAEFKDINPFGHQRLYLSYDPTLVPAKFTLQSWGRQDATLTAPVTIALGDWNNDSLKAYVGGRCARVADAHVTAAGFIPPYWANMQGDQGNKGGSMGEALSQEDTVERSLTYYRSSSVSAYVGFGASFSFLDLISIGGAAKTSAGAEWSTSNRTTNSSGVSLVTTAGRSWSDDALIYEPAEYKCYSYQLAQNGSPVPTDQARLRFCAYQQLPGAKPPLVATVINSWDVNFGKKPEYVPIVRDWSSWGLFRGPFTAQSSQADAQSGPELAVDSHMANGTYIDGAAARTLPQTNPWWQVDLGASRDISKIRLWAPKDGLANFYLLVSDNDFQTMPDQSNPASLLNRQDVIHYSLADLRSGWTMTDTAGSTSTFLTLDSQNHPIHGRYVRVQRADTGVLALAEVQVFGANHIDPDRYPLDMRDPTPNDGMMEVKLYNPYHTGDNDRAVWVQTRGNLLWDGRPNPVLNSLTVDRGDTTLSWSMAKTQLTSTAKATELDNNTSIGAEYEVEGAIGVQVQHGAGGEITTGLSSEVVQSTSWGNELNMGGQMQGFPTGYDGQDWVLDCRYRYQPYYYEVTETSNIGYHHRFPVLDYLVPDEGNSVDLNRGVDLSACRNGNPMGATQPQTDTAQALVGTPVRLNVLANDSGNHLKIVQVGAPQHGTVTNTARTITYTPAAGFVGTDTFTYTVTDAATALAAGAAQVQGEATGTVTVVVGAPAATKAVYLPLITR